MNKTKIEWCDYTINPVKGKCPMGCSYCYARRLYDRFKWNPEIRYDHEVFFPLADLDAPARIFVGSTIELFGDWVEERWLNLIFKATQTSTLKKHTFIFLTKQPQNLPLEWPDNCWVGVTITGQETWIEDVKARSMLTQIKAKVKFLSLEPLLRELKVSDGAFEETGINWVIIGQQTPVKKSTMPRLDWIKELVSAADRAGIPVFLKDNLYPFFDSDPDFGIVCRQEWPLNYAEVNK